MKIELDENASAAICAVAWAVALAVILTSFASCAARSDEAAAKAQSAKITDNTIITARP